jgi:hypothetical protein
MYQPKTGQRCTCKRGVQRDNCPACEGTGWRIDFQAIRDRARAKAEAYECADCGYHGHGAWNCERCGKHNLVRQ